MSQVAKRQALIFLVLALTTTLVIGAGLPRLRLQPGLPLPRLQDAAPAAALSENGPSSFIRISRPVLVLLLICLGAILLYGVYRLLRGVPWKEILSGSAYFLV